MIKLNKLILITGLVIGVSGIFFSSTDPALTAKWLGGGLFVIGVLFMIIDANEG